MTWKPRPDVGPPSAWIETAASECALLPIWARLLMHGPTPVSFLRVRTTFAPGVLEQPLEALGDVERVLVLGVAGARLGAGGVALLGLAVADRDRSVDGRGGAAVAAVVAGIDGDDLAGEGPAPTRASGRGRGSRCRRRRGRGGRRRCARGGVWQPGACELTHPIVGISASLGRSSLVNASDVAIGTRLVIEDALAEGGRAEPVGLWCVDAEIPRRARTQDKEQRSMGSRLGWARMRRVAMVAALVTAGARGGAPEAAGRRTTMRG